MKWTGLLSVLAVLVPCSLLLPLRDGFALDWVNHLWVISYFGDYYRAHGCMPSVLTTPQLAGEPMPIFYGYLFYPLLGWLSACVGPHAAVRLAVVGSLGLQFVLVRSVLRSLGCARGLALVCACLVAWATYPLTNLYNRSALTEFFAGAWLTCAACCWFLFWRAGMSRPLWAHALGFALFSALAAGTHPITAWMGAWLFAVLAAAGLLAGRGDLLCRRLLVLGVAGAGVVLCLAPWLYATALFCRSLPMAPSVPAPLITFDGIDQWYVRFFPLPLDLRCVRQDPGVVPSAYLDAQANVPLLVLVAVALARLFLSGSWRPGGFALGAVALVGVYLAFSVTLSLVPGATRLLPAPFTGAQFAYRWVNQINLALFVLLCVGLLVRGRGGEALPPLGLGGVFLGCVLTWAGAGLLIKLAHAAFTRQQGVMVNYQPGPQLPLIFYTAGGYSTPALYRGPLRQDAGPALRRHWEVDSAAAYGTARPLRVRADRPGRLITSAEGFAWNRLHLDGRAVSPRETQLVGYPEFIDPTGRLPWNLQAVVLPAGEHVVEYRFEPDPLWTGLARLSRLALAAVALGWVVLLLAPLRRGRAGRRCAVAPERTATVPFLPPFSPTPQRPASPAARPGCSAGPPRRRTPRRQPGPSS
jgi:hypothetical protein